MEEYVITQKPISTDVNVKLDLLGSTARQQLTFVDHLLARIMELVIMMPVISSVTVRQVGLGPLVK